MGGRRDVAEGKDSAGVSISARKTGLKVHTIKLGGESFNGGEAGEDGAQEIASSPKNGSGARCRRRRRSLGKQ